MATLRDIRKRIKSVKNTRQITKAMKMVSAAKLRRAQEAAMAARPYAQTLDKVMGQLMAGAEPGSMSHPLLTTRSVKKVELIVITSDRGLAGGFNSNITRKAARYLQEQHGKIEVSVTTIGRKGNDYMRGRSANVRKDFAGVLAKVSYAKAAEIATEVSNRFLNGDIDAAYIVYNEFVSVVTQVPTMAQLLPFEAKAGGKGIAQSDFLYEPNALGVLEKLVPQAVSVKLYRSMLESVASEHASRMTAMENATKNAGEMISTLSLYYNRSRQALITKELMEIVSGAEALK